MHRLILAARLSAPALIAGAACLAWAAPLQAQDALQASAVTERFDALLKELATQPSTPVALGKLHALGRLRLHVPTPHALDAMARAIAQTRDPLTKAALVRQHARATRELGPERAIPSAQVERELGCLTQFMIVGPLENPSMEGFMSAQPPELGEVGPYAGKLEQVTARPLPALSDLCILNIAQAVSPSDSATVFLGAQIQSPRKQRARLLIGASGAYRVWHNERLIAQRQQDVGLSPDNDAWALELAPGPNRLVIKLGSDASSGMDVMVRLVDDKLQPLQDVQHQPKLEPRTLQSAAQLKAAPSPQPQGVLAQLEAAAKAPLSPNTLWAAWLWREVERKNTATPWRDLADTIDAALKRGQLTLPGPDYALLAELYEEHWRRLALLEAAHKLHPDDPWVSYNLLQEYDASLSDELRLRRRGRLEALLKAHPHFTPALLQLADWYKERDLGHLALALLQARSPAPPYASPRQLMALMRLLQDQGQRLPLQALQAQARPFMYVSGGYAWREITDLLKRGQRQAALERILQERQASPWSLQWLIKHAEVLRALGQGQQALLVLDEGIAQRPGEVELMQRRAELLLALDRPEEAAQTLERALAARPQDQELRDHLEHLRPEASRFHEPWMVEDLRALDQAIAPGAFHTTTLLDQRVVQVASNGLAQQVSQQVERVNTPQGIDAARTFSFSYQIGDERIDILRVRVHKPDGSISEDYNTWSSEDSRKASTTYNDNATVTVRANNVQVGDLIEVRYRLSQVANQNFRGDYFGDISYVQGTTPVGMARYAVLYPEAWTLHFRPPSLKHTRVDSALPQGQPAPAGYKVTWFELRDVPDVKTDADQPGYTSVYDYILVSNKATWDDIGLWWWGLVKEQLVVDEPIRAKVRELTLGLKTPEQRLQAIHRYVVQNTRYLHVGLGIHGWKPYRTTTCFRNRFGDCKDKAALLKVMLEEAGIKANLVLVRTRRLGLVEAKPASMHVFNHAITYVPSMDLYLDGTAEFNGTRELTSMDQGAQALIVEDGGKTRFVTLPVDKPEQNLLEQRLVVDLSGPQPVARGELVATGSHAVYYRTALEDPERRDEVLGKQLASTYPGAKLLKATYSDLKALEQPVRISYTFSGGQLLRQSAQQEHVFPYGSPRDLLGAYASQPERSQALSLRVPFGHKAQVTYTLPASKSFGELPEPTQLTSPFGHARVSYARQGASLVVQVEYSIAQQEIAAKDYPAFRQFITEVHAALNATVEVKQER